ncbi:ClpXP protease specificity-enhancing factor [uncultured Thiodictyon sp.]|uniref:ClpXP protease specificity-enhancing factor n=1 Tax=uncultured Thiodictyon sp. TaxID=1846217 RepID=UPI0025D9121D|nr:ClpXP protease specificity-enhancing factor [uncultured Thiodictyon sp.]
MNNQDGFMTSTKPYLVRAIYEWILDNQMTPHVLVDVHYPGTRVPMEFAEDGQIVLNIAPSAVHGLVMDNDRVRFSARFGGVTRNLEFPSEAILGIFSRENHQGMVFPPTEQPAVDANTATPTRETTGPTLHSQLPKDDGTSPGKGTGKPKGRGGPTLKIVK